MNILVTGGAGFIGSHTVERLLRDAARGSGHRSWTASTTTTIPPSSARTSSHFADRVTLREGELTDAAFCQPKPSMKGRFDAVIHLAARAGVRPSIEQPELYIDTNIKGTFNLLEAAKATRVCKQFRLRQQLLRLWREQKGARSPRPTPFCKPSAPTP
jgi:UDP-glucuronate 4-epimerase